MGALRKCPFREKEPSGKNSELVTGKRPFHNGVIKFKELLSNMAALIGKGGEGRNLELSMAKAVRHFSEKTQLEGGGGEK